MNDELTPGSMPPGDAEQGDARSGPDTEPPSPQGPPTAGGMIRDARQAQGIDLASLAAMLKIPLRRLDALENGRHAELQGPTFERALAQAACRVLRIDPKPVLGLLPRHETNTLERVTDGINTPFRDGQGGGGFELPSLLHPWVLVVVLLIAAAAALFLVPQSWLTHASPPLVDGLAASAPAASPVASDAGAPVVAEAASDAATAPAEAAASDGVAVPPAPRAAAAGNTPDAVSATAAQGVDEVLAHVASAPTIPVQVIATADSWVEIVDAQGRTLLSRTVVAGESVGLDGPLPMRVKIGNAIGTHLRLRGDNVDLTPSTRDNVARLVLK